MLYRNKKKDDPNEGKWIGVGGKFEPGETPDACMLREVREETGLTPASYHFCGVIHFISDTWEDEDMYLYRAEIDGSAANKTPACEEGELRWIPENQLMDLPMWEGDRIFHRLLDEGVPFFELELVYSGEKLLSASLDGRKLAI